MSADSAGRAWDWADDAGDTIVEEQPAIACYTNPAGAVVLRQHGAWNDDDDAWIFFSPAHAPAIAAAILAAAGLDIEDLYPELAQVASAPKDPTAAARQRRRRARQREEPTLDLARDVTVAVTAADRDTVTETVTRDGRAST